MYLATGVVTEIVIIILRHYICNARQTFTF